MPYKRKRTNSFNSNSYPKKRISIISRGVGVARTGGNYNQIYPRRNKYGYSTSGGHERKFIDVVGGTVHATLAKAANTGGDAGAGNIELLNGVTLGTGATNRIGRRIKMKSILLRWIFTLQASSDGLVGNGMVPGFIRILIVMDMQANGATPAVSDILVNAGNVALVSPLNLDNRERFRVIYDKFRLIDPQGPGNTIFNVYKKLDNQVTFNAGNAGDQGDISTCAMWVISIVTPQAIAISSITGNLYSRIRFLDD